MNLLLGWRDMNARRCIRSRCIRSITPWVILLLALLVAAGMAQESVTFDKAQDLFRQQRYSEAAVAFDSIEKSSPGTSDALLFVGKSLINLGRFSEAGVEPVDATHPEFRHLPVAILHLAYCPLQRQNGFARIGDDRGKKMRDAVIY